MSTSIISEETQKAVQEHLHGNLHKYSNADPQILSEYIGALLTRTQNVEDLHKSFLAEMKEFMKEHTEKFVQDLFAFLSTREPHLFRTQFGSAIVRNAAKGTETESKEERDRHVRRPRRVIINQPGKRRPRRFDFGPPTKQRHRDRSRRGRDGRTYSRSRSRSRSRTRSRSRSRDRERNRDRRRRKRRQADPQTVEDIYNKLWERLMATQAISPGIPLMPGAGLPPMMPHMQPYGRPVQQQRFQEQRLSHRRAGRILRPNVTSSEHIQKHIQQHEAARRQKEAGNSQDTSENTGESKIGDDEKNGGSDVQVISARISEKDKNALLDGPLDELRLPSDAQQPDTRYNPASAQVGGRLSVPRFLPRRTWGGGNNRTFTFHPSRRETQMEDKRQIVINNIPSHLCSVVHLTNYFSQFGDIENIQQHKDKNRAFVQFTKHEEALAAIESTEPVLGQNDVEVRWAYFNRPDYERNARMRADGNSGPFDGRRTSRRSFSRTYGDASGSGLTDAVINGIPQDQFRQKKASVAGALRNLRAENKNRWFAPDYEKNRPKKCGRQLSAQKQGEVDKLQENIESVQNILEKEFTLLEKLDGRKQNEEVLEMKKELLEKIRIHQALTKELMKQQKEKIEESMPPSANGSPHGATSLEKIVSNLPSKILLVSKWAKHRTLSEADFRVHFQKFGDVKSVELLSNHAARVEFQTLDGAVQSYRNGKTFENIELEIQYADPLKCVSKFSGAIPSMWSENREESAESIERDVIAIDDDEDEDEDDDMSGQDRSVSPLKSDRLRTTVNVPIEISDDEEDAEDSNGVAGDGAGEGDVAMSESQEKAEEDTSSSAKALEEMVNITVDL